MNATDTEGPVRIEEAGLTLVNLTKLTIDYGSSKSDSVFKPECFYSTHREQSIVSHCIQELRTLLTATECTLRWCINRYSARQNSGNFTETYLDSWLSPLGAGADIVTVPESGYNTEYIRMLPPDTDGDVTVYKDVHDQQRSAPSHLPKRLYPCYVPREKHETLSLWLMSFFTSTLTLPSNSSAKFKFRDTDRPDAAGVLSGATGTFAAEGFPQTDPMPNIFQNVALGLTQSMREDARFGADYKSNHFTDGGSLNQMTRFAGNTTAIGTAFEVRTVVRIRWGWLSFPVGLVGMTALVTISTKIRSSRQHLPLWGSSTMALMLCGPYSTAFETSSPLPTSSHHESQLKVIRTEVVLEETADGSWKLSERRKPAAMRATYIPERSK